MVEKKKEVISYSRLLIIQLFSSGWRRETSKEESEIWVFHKIMLFIGNNILEKVIEILRHLEEIEAIANQSTKR